jgi:hypothetical protein
MTPSDDEGLREELKRIFYKWQDDSGTFYHNQATEAVMALISQKIIEAKLQELENIEVHKQHPKHWASQRREYLLSTLTTKQDAKEK